MILETLKKSSRLLLATHIRPDGDAIGSLLALGRGLSLLGKEVDLYNESPIPAIFRFLPGLSDVKPSCDPLTSYDAMVVLDCSDIARIGQLGDRIPKGLPILNIDHHITNTHFGTHHWIDASSSSTGEMIYHLLGDLGVEVDADIAYAIYTAILTDTGSFLFQNTTPECFAICGEMAGKGVDTYKVAQHLFATYSLGRLKLLNMVLETIEISDNGRLSVMYLTQEMLKETETDVDDINGLVNYAKYIEDVQVAVLIQEARVNVGDEGRYHVSLRSNGPVDVGAIAASYGGGGHPGAAAFTAKTSLREVKREVMKISEGL